MLVAEELAASGCSLVISVTSAGVIAPLGDTPYFILIERALRDEGTSVHYLPPAKWSQLAAPLRAALDGAFENLDEPVHPGASWTTDAPFRETETAIAAARSAGAHAGEMEAAGDDFEKGEADGAYRILDVVGAIAKRLRPGAGSGGERVTTASQGQCSAAPAARPLLLDVLDADATKG